MKKNIDDKSKFNHNLRNSRQAIETKSNQPVLKSKETIKN